MMHAYYATKKELKGQVGQRLKYGETSMFGPEFKSNGVFCVTNIKRSWFAEVTMKDGLIAKVK